MPRRSTLSTLLGKGDAIGSAPHGMGGAAGPGSLEVSTPSTGGQPTMQVTRGMRRQSMKLARRRERLPADALIAGVDLAKKESVVIFVRAADRARVGRLL